MLFTRIRIHQIYPAVRYNRLLVMLFTCIRIHNIIIFLISVMRLISIINGKIFLIR